MGPEYYLVGGIVLAILAIPALVSAWVDSRPPWKALIVVLIAGALVLQYTRLTDGRITLDETTRVFARVIGDMLR